MGESGSEARPPGPKAVTTTRTHPLWPEVLSLGSPRPGPSQILEFSTKPWGSVLMRKCHFLDAKTSQTCGSPELLPPVGHRGWPPASPESKGGNGRATPVTLSSPSCVLFGQCRRRGFFHKKGSDRPPGGLGRPGILAAGWGLGKTAPLAILGWFQDISKPPHLLYHLAIN